MFGPAVLGPPSRDYHPSHFTDLLRSTQGPSIRVICALFSVRMELTEAPLVKNDGVKISDGKNTCLEGEKPLLQNSDREPEAALDQQVRIVGQGGQEG